MEFEHFSFIVRFRADGETIETYWNALFSFFTKEETAGCKLYYRYDDTKQLIPEDHYVLTVSDMSVKNARLLTVRFKNEFPFPEYLSLVCPFPQNNDFRDAPAFDVLGKVDENGTVSGGMVSIGDMRFHGSASTQKKDKLAVTFIPTAYGRAKDALERFRGKYPDHRMIVYPGFEDVRISVTTIALDNGGIYCKTAEGYEYFRMYDNRIVFSCSDADTVQTIYKAASERGFERFLCVPEKTDIRFSTDDPAIEITSLKDFFKCYYKNSTMHVHLNAADIIATDVDTLSILKQSDPQERKYVQI